jgi:DNA (cytosine-5)-methyltransferase 1
MFPYAVRAVREVRPKAFVFENVKGLLRESFSTYFHYIYLQLQYPSIQPRDGEQWIQHLDRLEKKHTRGGSGTPEYRVAYRLVNAANFGVPQRRERVFIVGFRDDIQIPWSFPEGSHTREALLADKWGTGDYWERHRVSRREVHAVRKQTSKLEIQHSAPQLIAARPWRTVRDALDGLGEPARTPNEVVIPNHLLQEGARSYAGHTGSPLDEPAKTLKAGDHGVPGGENMLRNPDGSVRYFTVRESARLQTFPDRYHFQGSWTENMRQLGNAVPVELAEHVIGSVRTALETHVESRRNG